MNIGLDTPQRGNQCIDTLVCPGCNIETVRGIALGMQVDALHSGFDFGTYLLVAWQDQPREFLSVLTLGDEVAIDE